jgi:1-acyl-sn-glycerol-3-phosphate acyltransferase
MTGLTIQTIAGRMASLVLAPLYILFLRVMGYRIRDLRRIRRQWKDLTREHAGPWLSCANHLTMIDSLLITYGLLSLLDHFRNYERVPWNLPEQANFYHSLSLRVICYLSKCLPVHRGGNRDDIKNTLVACRELLAAKQHLMIFPEGGRSRTGRIDRENFSYGAGRFMTDHPDCRVLCVYLRGDRQENYSTFPHRGDRFTLEMHALIPEPTALSGLKAQRHHAGRIIEDLSQMEEEYFALHRERYCLSGSAGQPGKNPGPTLSGPGLHI